MLRSIKDNDVKIIRNEILLSLENDFQQEKERLSKEFTKNFVTICENIVDYQKKGIIDDIQFIIFTVLRTRIAENNYKFPVKVCNQLWWLDENHRDVGEYDAGFVFRYYEKMKERLETERKKYAGKTVKQDIDSILSDEIINFLYYVARMAKYKILRAAKSKSFINIKKCPNIQIHVGEYLGFSELIFNQDQDGEDLERIIEKIKRKKRNDLCFYDLRGLDLNGWDLSDSDFRFADMGDSVLTDANLSYSLLAGTIFNNCDLENVNFNFCVLNEANFENSNCKGAKFMKIIAYAGLEDSGYWDVVGYYPVNFTNADLRYADFSGSDIRGAIFDGADLRGAVFDETQMNYLRLTNKQKSALREV
jgi:uncharacterized protein YjbI with pentapeptide repeats